MAPVTCMLRVCTYSCAVVDFVTWDLVVKFDSPWVQRTYHPQLNSHGFRQHSGCMVVSPSLGAAGNVHSTRRAWDFVRPKVLTSLGRGSNGWGSWCMVFKVSVSGVWLSPSCVLACCVVMYGLSFFFATRAFISRFHPARGHPTWSFMTSHRC